MPDTYTPQSGGRSIGARRLGALLSDVTMARPVYRHLAAAIRALILDGRIALHVKLPAERELAPTLRMSRATVTAAYDLLRESGYALSRRGSGTWTAVPDGGETAGVSRLLPAPDAFINLTAAALALPEEVLSDALAKVAPRLTERAQTAGYNPFGLIELRAAVAQRYTRRGLPTRPEQIIITSGAQQALMLTIGLLCGPGDRVMVENPSYPNALEAIRRARLRMAPVPVTESGWDLEIMESTLRQVVPRLAYLIPDFQNPVGCLMPLAQRARIASATRKSGTWLVIDETLADIALDVPVPAPYASHAAPGEGDHVITIGSLSKTLWGGMRIGWLRAAPRLINEIAGLRVTVDMAGSVLDQLLAVALMESTGDWLTTRIAQVRAQRDALAGALGRHAPQWDWRLPAGGLSLWVDLGRPVASALADRALGHGVRIESGARFGADPGTFEHRLRIPYTLPADTLDEAVRRLAASLDERMPLESSVERPHWVV